MELKELIQSKSGIIGYGVYANHCIHEYTKHRNSMGLESKAYMNDLTQEEITEYVRKGATIISEDGRTTTSEMTFVEYVGDYEDEYSFSVEDVVIYVDIKRFNHFSVFSEEPITKQEFISQFSFVLSQTMSYFFDEKVSAEWSEGYVKKYLRFFDIRFKESRLFG